MGPYCRGRAIVALCPLNNYASNEEKLGG